jgi:PIN domain nuclease of toxin-antitoxin system
VKILLDTHAFLWFVAGSDQLSARARQLIEAPDNESFVSIASLWEIAIKVSLGRLSLTKPFSDFMAEQTLLNGIQILGIAIAHTAEVAALPFHHRDPFDRLLIAQAMVEEMPLVSADAAFDAYPITRLW